MMEAGESSTLERKAAIMEPRDQEPYAHMSLVVGHIRWWRLADCAVLSLAIQVSSWTGFIKGDQ